MALAYADLGLRGAHSTLHIRSQLLAFLQPGSARWPTGSSAQPDEPDLSSIDGKKGSYRRL